MHPEVREGNADRIRAKMLPDVAQILMPAADRAVAALESIHEGFFIREQCGDDELILRMPDGQIQSRSPERATALLLKILRNASHGYGHRKGAKAPS